MAPPSYGQGGYQSPYYAPTGPQAPVHRTPWTMIVAIVLAVVIVLAGGGTVLALISNHNSTNQGTNSPISELPSPSPATTPSPIASPTATATAGNGTVSNDGVTMPLPTGWTVESKDNETIVVSDPDTAGVVTAASGYSSPTQTAQDNKNTIDKAFTGKYPDARECSGTSAHNGAYNGAAGIFWQLCFTLTSGSNSAPVALWLFVGANGSGSVYYLVMVATTADNLQNFLNTAKPVLQGIQWRLS
jgi:hypothetical protein